MPPRKRLKFTKPERRAIKRQVLFTRRDRARFDQPTNTKWFTRVEKAHVLIQRYWDPPTVRGVVDLTRDAQKPTKRRPVLAVLYVDGRRLVRRF